MSDKSAKNHENGQKGFTKRDWLISAGTAGLTLGGLWLADRLGAFGSKKTNKANDIDAGIEKPDAGSDLDNIVDSSAPRPKPDTRPVYEIDISDSFVPWPISLTPYAKTFQRLRKSGRDYTMYGVNPALSRLLKPAKRYQKIKSAYASLGDFNVDKVMSANYTSWHTVRGERNLHKWAKKAGFANIDLAIADPRFSEKYKLSIMRYQKTRKRLDKVKDLQKRLKLEGHYNGRINGNYNATMRAIRRFQSANGLKADGSIGRGTAKWLSPSKREQLECKKVQDLLEERVFYSTWVLNKDDMKKVMEQANKQLGLNDIEGVVSFLSKYKSSFRKRGAKIKLKLDVPENYKVDEMKLEGIIYKRRGRRKGRLVRPQFRLYQIYTGKDGKEKKIELYRVDVATGGRNKDYTDVIKAMKKKSAIPVDGDVVLGGPDPKAPIPSVPDAGIPKASGDAGAPLPRPTIKNFPTPTGTVYWRYAVVAPAWVPPKWDDPDTKEVAKKPGIHNAYGLLMFPFFTTPEVPDKYMPKKRWRDYHYSASLYSKRWIGIKAHSTGSPMSIARGGSSHGCVRFYPSEAMRLFPFIMHYSRLMPTSREARFRNRKRGQLLVPFEKGSYVKIDIVDKVAPRD